jgi:hypothetical protein
MNGHPAFHRVTFSNLREEAATTVSLVSHTYCSKSASHCPTTGTATAQTLL